MKYRETHIRIISVVLVLFLCITVCCTASADMTGKVIGGWLILREAPSPNGRQLASYPKGTVVVIVGQSGSWYKVETPDGLTGYMMKNYLEVSGSSLIEGAEAWVTSSNGLNVRLRSGNGTQYSAIASYAPGTKCTILRNLGQFCQIQIGSLSGYMMTKFLTAEDPGSGGGTVLYDVYVTSTNGRGVNLRSSAVKGNNVIGFYEVGTRAGMISEGNVWSLILIDGKVGYMMTEFLTDVRPGPFVPTGNSYIMSYNGKSVNLRSGPGMRYQVLNSYSPGTPVTIVTPGDEWDYVKIGSLYGYMMDQYIITK